LDTFRKIKRLWVEKLNLASKRKEKEFGQYARECWKYYASPNHDFLYDGGDAADRWGLMPNAPRVTINKCFQFVDVFKPYIHHRNPKRSLTERRPVIDPALRLAALPQGYIESLAQQLAQQGILQQQMQMAAMQGQMADPMAIAQQFAMQMLQQKNGQQEAMYAIRKQLLESVLDYTPQEFNLIDESHRSLTEALVCGRGVWHTKIIQSGQGSLPGTVHIPVERFLVDPDFLCARDWKWVAFENIMPKHLFAAMVGIDEKELKTGFDESTDKKAVINIEGRETERNKADESTHDLIRYWEVYSRCGVGTSLSGADEDIQGTLRELGDNVRLIISDCWDEPLNLREDMFGATEAPKVREARNMTVDGLKWPLPFFKDSTWPWPFSLCDFHHQNDSAWPVAHLRPALPAQRMLNWLWSHVAAKIKKTAKDKWLYDLNILDDATLRKVINGVDEEFVGVKKKQSESLKDLMFQMQHAPMNADVFNVAQFYEVIFEQVSGLSALMSSGESNRQMRSSYEAQLKEKIVQGRPEAMADVYENTQSRIARNEAIALRMLSGGEMSWYFREQAQPDPTTGQTMLGELSQLWEQTVYEPDEDRLVAETDCRIESGSMRKPNVGEALTGLTEFTQVMLQPLMAAYQQTGDPTNMNVLLGELSKKTQMPPMFLPDMRQMMAQQQQQPPQKGQAA
jgi:hypothetical protein